MRFRNFRVFSPKSGFVVLDQMNYLELELSLVLFMKVVRNVERKVLSNFGDNWGWPEIGRCRPPAAAELAVVLPLFGQFFMLIKLLKMRETHWWKVSNFWSNVG